MRRYSVLGKAVAATLGLAALVASAATAADVTARPAVYTHFKSSPTASVDLPMQIPSTPNLSTQISSDTPVTTVGWRHRGYGGYGYGYRGGYGGYYGGYRGYYGGYRPYGYGYGYANYGYRPYVAYCYPSYGYGYNGGYGYGGGYYGAGYGGYGGGYYGGGYPYMANYGYAGYGGGYGGQVYGRPYYGAPYSWGW